MTHGPTDVVDLARDWIGTPYHHQGSCKGIGTDCLGLIRGLWREIYGAEPAVVPNYTSDWSEPSQSETLLDAAAQFLIRQDGNPVHVDAAQLGQVLVFRMHASSVAKHLGIVSQAGPHPHFIHAYSGHGVVESPLSPPWARRIAAQFRFPERT